MPELDGEFVRKCLQNNERGDGVLYSTLHQNRFMFNKAIGKWMIFDKHHWELDYMDSSMVAVEQVAMAYHAELVKLDPKIEAAITASSVAGQRLKRAEAKLKAAQIKTDAAAMAEAAKDLDAAAIEKSDADYTLGNLKAEHKTFARRIERLRAVKGSENCLKWAHCIDKALACKGDEFDQHPMKLATPGGIIDLVTGQIRPGKPADMIMRSITTTLPTDYTHLEAYLRDENVPSPCPEWDKFFNEIHLDDAEIIDFHGRYLGYTITGLTSEQYYLCCIGDGANGKGVMGDVISDILGQLSWDISPELILEQKNARASSGPSADLISLMGRRMVIASETDDNRRISCSMIKKLTGQDKITARSPHEKYEITFTPCFKLIFRTNAMPLGLTKDFAMRRRLLLIHYPLMYVADPAAEAADKPQQAHLFRQQDQGLRDKLRKEKSGILLWLLKQCLKYQRDGLNPPDKIKAAVTTLYREEDHLGRFINDVCEREDCQISFREFYGAFAKWYGHEIDAKDKYLPSKKNVSAQLVKRGFKRTLIGGQTYFHGLYITSQAAA